ncbi:hypothetical protein [Sneathiella glossodoripedis]|uniref:hypothetical protein n=1 Tax=Sneathiella glossodoripedis TaxID=418853 RepID=UPI00046EC676|nr:hypothetical protein [Sneathiella glossodoripedis]
MSRCFYLIIFILVSVIWSERSAHAECSSETLERLAAMDGMTAETIKKLCLQTATSNVEARNISNTQRYQDGGERCAVQASALSIKEEGVWLKTETGTLAKECCIGKSKGNYITVNFYNSINRNSSTKVGSSDPMAVWANNAKTWKTFNFDVTSFLPKNQRNEVKSFDITWTGMGGC